MLGNGFPRLAEGYIKVRFKVLEAVCDYHPIVTAIGYMVRTQPCGGWHYLSRALIKCHRDDYLVAICCLHFSDL